MSENRALGGLEDSPKDTIKHGKNHLFAIGINTYQKFTPLLNAVKDVEDIAKVLSEDYSFDSILLLSDQDATKDNIIDKLDGLRRSVAPEDKLLIYYSGHGFTDNDRGFWIPVDAEPDRVSSYIANAEVHDIIQFIKARHILLISDSCFSGSLLVRDVASDMGGAFDDWDRNPSRYAFISGGGVVSDGKPGENSPFAGGIIKQLRDNEENAINICRLADQVTQEIRYNYRQQAEVSPIFEVGHKGGQFVFVKKQTEKEVWAAALANHDEGSYLDYLGRYPKGKFLNEAEQKLKDIADENEWSKAAQKDAAISYRQYLKIYPDGKHVSEANSKLEAIKQEDLRDKEAARKLEQERLFILEKENIRKQTELEQANEAKKNEIEKQTDKENVRKQEQERVYQEEKERKEKELAALQESSKTPKTKAPVNKPNFQPDNLSTVPSKKSGSYIKYYYILAIVGVIIFAFFLLKQKSPTENKLIPDPIPDTPTQIKPNIIPDDTRQLDGIVNDLESNPLAGAIVINKRTGVTVTTDTLGHFAMANVKDGDSLVFSKKEDFLPNQGIILKDQKSGIFNLQPRLKINRTITGRVEHGDGTGIPGAVVFQYRSGNYIKLVKVLKSDGTFTMTKVNDGDVICVKWLPGQKSQDCKKKTLITSVTEYKFIVD